MDTIRAIPPTRHVRRAGLLAVLAAGLTAAIGLPAVASPAIVWSGFQGDPAHSGYAVDGPRPPYREAWTVLSEPQGPSSQFGLAQPAIVDDVAVTLASDAVIGIDLASGRQAWTVDRDPGPAVPAAATPNDDAVAIVYTEGFGPHPPGSRASASASASQAPSADSGSGSVGAGPVDSHLAAIDASSQDALWKPVELDAVSYTGVTAVDGVAYAATETGSVYAVDLETGQVDWTVDAGEPVDTPLVVTDGLVIALTRATNDVPASVVALAAADGSETWRWKSDTPVYRLSAASADDAHVFVGLSDQNGTLRALDLTNGSLAWTARLNAAINLVSAPAVADQAVFALDYRGQLYRFDAQTGERDWDFALNELVLRSAPVVVGGHVILGTTSGRLAAIDAGSGELVWQAVPDGGQLRSFAVTPDRLVAVRGGSRAGLVAFDHDPDGELVRLTSPTVLDPVGLVGAFAIGGLAFCIVAILGGRWLLRRAGPALAEASEDLDDPELDDDGNEA